jgi:hypothetical protein
MERTDETMIRDAEWLRFFNHVPTYDDKYIFSFFNTDSITGICDELHLHFSRFRKQNLGIVA